MENDFVFIRFKNSGKVWVLEPSKEITELEVSSDELLHVQILPHADDNYCHLKFSDGGLVRDVQRTWLEVIED